MGAKSAKRTVAAGANGCESRQKAAPRADERTKNAKSLRNNLTQDWELVFFMLDVHIIPGRWHACFGTTSATEL